MGNVLTTFQLFGTFAAFGTIIFIYRAKSSEPQRILFAGSVFIFINMLGYYFELSAHNIESALLGIKMEYIGNALGSLLFIFFVSVYCPRHRYRIWKILYLINNLFVLFLVLTSPNHQLYYQSVRLEFAYGMAHVMMTPGPFYYWWILSSSFLGFLIIYMASVAYHEYKNKDHPEYAWMIAASAIPILSWPLNLFRVLGHYDIGPVSLLMTTMCLAFITNKYRMFDTVTTAKDNLIDELIDGIIVYDANDNLVYFNKAAAVIFPQYGKEPRKEAEIAVSEFLDQNEDSFMIQGRCYQWRRQLLFDERNTYLGQIVRIMDDTDNYRYKNQLLALKNDAEKANRAKSMFLTNISHEIRTPLNAIMGLDELILRESSTEDIKDYALNIREAGKTLLAIINDILDMSRIESGKIEIIPDHFELNSFLYNIYAMTSIKAEEAGLRFVMNANKQLPNFLYGDETRLKQCVMNLLSNAVKYTKKGTVTFTVDFIPVSEEEIELKLTVSDTGIGIRQSDLTKIFNTFERIDGQINKGIEGTGLGLNITKELVEMMNGELQVESVYGEGSTFSIRLPQQVKELTPIGPLNLKHSVQEESLRSRYEFWAPEASVLIVDDNEVNIAVVKGLLKKTGVQTDKAQSGAECLDKVRKNEYDLILMDHMMPGMDGIETLKKLRQMTDCKSSTAPCIVLTANAVSGSREMYLEKEFTDYLAKPVSAEALFRLVMKYLPKELLGNHKV